jgi:hypothetical protein
MQWKVFLASESAMPQDADFGRPYRFMLDNILGLN